MGHPSVAIDLNNLAQSINATNRLAEAEPISWRMVTIFIAFQKKTGHEHPHIQVALANYLCILIAMGLSEEEALAKIQAKLRGDAP